MPIFSRFYVLYSTNPQPGHKFRQITARPSDDGSHFEVRIFGGDVIQTDPSFIANNPDAEYYSHTTAESANKDADEERDRSLTEGWLIYTQ
jgi:hypothetical protein